MASIRPSVAALALTSALVFTDSSFGAPILLLQQAASGQLRSEHVEVAYPEGAEDVARGFLDSAEEVYADIDSLFGGALPASINVNLVKTGLSRSTPGGLVLSLEQEGYAEAIFARELAHLAGRGSVGPLYDAEAYQVFREGLAAWVGARYEPSLGSHEPRWLWGAYAYMEEATYFEYLEIYSRASEELGKDVIDAVGYTLVDHLVDRHGWRGVTSVLETMVDNVEICGALDDAGLDCLDLWESWQAKLESEAANHDFAHLPKVFADLEVEGEGETRSLILRVFIRNPETSSYLFFVSYEIDGERFEESYPADSVEFEALVALGDVSLGTKVLWEAAVWSRTVQTWRKSGWQDRIIR
jgi:hypothetical protein